jgi:hypothetical protein
MGPDYLGFRGALCAGGGTGGGAGHGRVRRGSADARRGRAGAGGRLTPHLPRHVLHLAEVANLPSIERHGLLSTSRLLDLAGVRGDERARLERAHRPDRATLPNGVVIRDQRPMPPAALARCLIGITPAEWYALLNSKVFFGATTGGGSAGGRGYRPSVVRAGVDTAALARHAGGPR